MSQQNASQQTPRVETRLAKIGNAYLPMIEGQMEGNSIHFSEYSRHCVLMAISTINGVLEKAKIDWNSPLLDRGSLTSILLNVATLQLNAAAQPREVYFITRKTKSGDDYITHIEMGVEGDGNDALLRRFGAGVERVYPYWAIRKGDKYTPPRFKGVEVSPPEWEPQAGGNGEVITVVYPVRFDDGRVEYFVTERDSVFSNLLAHISNNLMNETFGIAPNRYNAKPDQLKDINARKKALIKKARALGLDATLDDEELEPYISPAWKEPHSRDAMILRKMRNNIVKKIPKDFGSGFIAETYSRMDEDSRAVQEEIAGNSNMEPIELEPSEPDALPENATPHAAAVESGQAAQEPPPEPEQMGMPLPDAPPATPAADPGF